MSFIINKGNKRHCQLDEVIFQLGKVMWLPFCIAGFWFAHTGYDRYGELAECAIRRMCGLPCPGCGGTRAFYYLFQGNFSESFRQNPVVIYGVIAYLHFMLLYIERNRMCLKNHLNHTGDKRKVHVEYYAYGAIFVILSQWIYKLIRILLYIKEYQK